MSSGQLLVVLAVAAVTLVAVAVLRRAGIAAPVVLVVAGLIIGFLPFVPDVSLPPEVVLLGLLPLLVFDAAATSSPTAFFHNARSIWVLAVPLVVVTAFGVAAVAHWLGHVPWPLAFVLGTAVGPTDASAAISVARRIGPPRRLVAILEGEALFNDATALVLYAAAISAATTGHFSPLHTAGEIAYAVVVGGAIGLAVGFAGRWLRNRVDDPPIEIAGSILLAYAAYLPAEAVHASGVLAAVTAGLYLGWHSSSAFSARSRLQSGAFWQTLIFLVDAFLFVLVGLSFHTFTAQARGPAGRLALTGAAVVLTVLVIRLAWMEGSGRMVGTRLLRGRAPARLQAPAKLRDLAGRGGRALPSPPRQQVDPGPPGWRGRLFLSWSGMRGGITLAALLAVPVLASDHQALAGRDDVIYLGFAVIIVTLVGQGMTLPVLMRWLRLSEHPSVADAERQARLDLTRAVLEHLGRACDEGKVPAELTEGLRAQYLARLHWLESSADDEDAEQEAADAAEAAVAMRRDLIAFQRETLAGLRQQGRIGTTTLRAIEHDLDLEEARLPGL
ncbi:MAG TPA: cation:proton antiporter [Streptosporangiaceae bacterium]